MSSTVIAFCQFTNGKPTQSTTVLMRRLQRKSAGFRNLQSIRKKVAPHFAELLLFVWTGSGQDQCAGGGGESAGSTVSGSDFQAGVAESLFIYKRNG